MTSVLLVDAHEVVRRGVESILGETEDLHVVGYASTVAGALLRVKILAPDVVIVGAHFEIGSGVDLCRELLSRFPNTYVLMLSAQTNTEVMVAAFLAGASGAIDKTISAADMVIAVRSVGAGVSLLNRQTAANIAAQLRAAIENEPGPFPGLSDQERQVLDLIGEGMTNRQIAAEMFVAEKTVKNYVSHVLTKLGLASRQQAAIAVTEERMTHPEASDR
jgi:two-component system response regulator DevR